MEASPRLTSARSSSSRSPRWKPSKKPGRRGDSKKEDCSVAEAQQEPIQDVAHLGHVEIFSPKPDESLWFFKEVLGMEEAAREGQSVYLRAFGDFDHNTLKLTEAENAGMGHTGWRAASPQALDRRGGGLGGGGGGQGGGGGGGGAGPGRPLRGPARPP